MSVVEHGERRFDNAYILKREIGRGASAIVYEAEDVRTPLASPLVAIKIFDHSVQRKDFLDEAQTQGRLHHPNILPLYWHGEVDDQRYMAMMLADEGALKDILNKRRRLQLDTAFRYILGTANGMMHAHDEGVVHRDLKPGNILIHQGVPRVNDWGVSVEAHVPGEAFTKQEKAITPEYSAPEQFDDRSTIASDIYSLGVVAFELITGRRPFIAQDTRAYIKAHSFQQPPSFETILGPHMTSTHEMLEPVVQQSLLKEEFSRPATMGEFGELLTTAYARAQGENKKDGKIIDVGRKERRIRHQEAGLPSKMERAKEILGQHVFGIEELKELERRLQRAGVSVTFPVDKLPDLPEEQKLVAANRLGETLILRPKTVIKDGEEVAISLPVLKDIIGMGTLHINEILQTLLQKHIEGITNVDYHFARALVRLGLDYPEELAKRYPSVASLAFIRETKRFGLTSISEGWHDSEMATDFSEPQQLKGEWALVNRRAQSAPALGSRQEAERHVLKRYRKKVRDTEKTETSTIRIRNTVETVWDFLLHGLAERPLGRGIYVYTDESTKQGHTLYVRSHAATQGTEISVISTNQEPQKYWNFYISR